MSKLKLKNYIKSNEVKCIFDTKDRYGRAIAECYINTKNVNSWLVRNGYAIAYRKYSKKYVKDEIIAKKKKLGIWQGSFEIPEKWRRKNK